MVMVITYVNISVQVSKWVVLRLLTQLCPKSITDVSCHLVAKCWQW